MPRDPAVLSGEDAQSQTEKIDALAQEYAVASGMKDYDAANRVYDRFLSVMEPGVIIETALPLALAKGRRGRRTRRAQWKFYKNCPATCRMRSTSKTAQPALASMIGSWPSARMVWCPGSFRHTLKTQRRPLLPKTQTGPALDLTPRRAFEAQVLVDSPAHFPIGKRQHA
jgi:hypothetical protein